MGFSRINPWFGALCGFVVAASGCGSEKAMRPNGSSCEEAVECASGLCLGSVCVDPEGDADNDGVPNRVESALGSNGFEVDTDADGIADRAELGEVFAPVDTDGDGALDILESAVLDDDGDCITNQYDARDAVADNDLSPMIPKVCNLGGICANQRDALAVACPDGALAVCVYDAVVGYANPESACDGRDENCDGAVDEAFVDADGQVACPGPTPYLGHATGGGITLESNRYRARLTVGPAVLGPARGARYQATIGAFPENMQVQPSGGQ
jgi:hypothetical protein